MVAIDLNNYVLSCKALFALQLCMSQALVAIVEVILALRVHALYNQHFQMAYFLRLLIGVGFVISIAGLILAMREIQFDAVCAVIRVNSLTASPILVFFVSEGILLILTAIKFLYNFWVVGHCVPMITLMLRDKILLCLAITPIMALTTAFLLIDPSHGELTLMLYPWFNALLSCAGCRLIINVQRLPMSQDQCPQSSSQTPPILTSRIIIESPDASVENV
ncbi:hypothetical protein BJ138DRAFT_1140327 [Hygrophoropsis aurantiaca]|uniref:Uncharacterized protein n=1 Tax=Hygrophoropsis aurantiaca TaxID=72124 RepID=A0ACB8ASH9_9AGAM|nr:hypothetical protein BJ138DRAFT_1140327 [Hygrophoropsis aurantiaca]